MLKPVVRNTAWSIGAEGVRLVSSVVTFLVLTQLYSPREFGVLIATTNLFGFVFPIASVGAGWLVLRRVAVEGWTVEDALARAAGAVIVGGVGFGVCLLALRPFILPQASVVLFVGLAVSELLFVGMVEVTLFAAQARERLVTKAAVWTTYGLGRAAAAVVLLAATDDPDLGPWIAANAGVAFVVLVIAQRVTLGTVVVPTRPTWGDLREGLPYSLGFGAERARDTTDTFVLVRLDRQTDAGLYSAARRLLNVTQAPLIAALHAANARIWRAGGTSPRDARREALRWTGVGLAYSACVALGLVVIGGPLAALLSDSYAETGEVLVWMSGVPALLALELFIGTAVTATGLQTHRVVLTLVTGAANLVLNLAWVPDHGWRGAVAATYLTSIVHVVGLWALSERSVRRHALSTDLPADLPTEPEIDLTPTVHPTRATEELLP